MSSEVNLSIFYTNELVFALPYDTLAQPKNLSQIVAKPGALSKKKKIWNLFESLVNKGNKLVL